MKHTIPLGTHVSFEGESFVYIVSRYNELLECESDCSLDHDCYPEPYIRVDQVTGTAFPLSKLRTVFEQDHCGRPPTVAEKTSVEDK